MDAILQLVIEIIKLLAFFLVIWYFVNIRAILKDSNTLQLRMLEQLERLSGKHK
jgi:hypothetical protein